MPSMAQHAWEAFVEVLEVYETVEGNVVNDVDNTATNSTQSSSSPTPQSKHEQDRASDTKHSGSSAPVTSHHSDATEHTNSKVINNEEVDASNGGETKFINDTPFPEEVNTDPIYQDLARQNGQLRHENVRHLRWQDKASMTIKETKEEVLARKLEARAAKKAALRTKAAMRRQVNDLERQVRASGQEKARTSNEHARAIQAHENRLQEMRKELAAQKEKAELAAAEAERQLTNAQTEHDAEMSTAESEIERLTAAQTSLLTYEQQNAELRAQLSQAEQEKSESLAAKDQQIQTLTHRLSNRDFEINRLRSEARSHVQARRQAIQEKNALYHAKVIADREAEELRAENQDLESEKAAAETEASEAAGRIRGIRGQLKAEETKADVWRAECQRAQEDARHKVLSAYEVTEPLVWEEGGQCAGNATGEAEASATVEEKLRQEKGELEVENEGLKAELKEWDEKWEKAAEFQKGWEQKIRREWETEKEKEEALSKARAKDRAAPAEEKLPVEKSELQVENDRLKAQVEQWRQFWQKADKYHKERVQRILRECETAKGNALSQARANDRAAPVEEKLLKEKSELQVENDSLKANVERWSRFWDGAVKANKERDQRIRRAYETKMDEKEKDIRRQCETEKEKALTEQREKLRVQWVAHESSLKAQHAQKNKTRTNQELLKPRRSSTTAHKKPSKVKKTQAKWVLGRAVSRAVDVERSLLQKKFRLQFQTQLAEHKTRVESDNAAKAQAQHGPSSATAQILQHPEVRKRDGDLASSQTKLKQAYEEKRATEADLKAEREESKRLSRRVITLESDSAAAAGQNPADVQLTLMAQDLSRALSLLAETATMGLDENSRNLLNFLVEANRAVRNLRTTIEDGQPVFYDVLEKQLDDLIETSDELVEPHPSERPALAAQLEETFVVMGGLINVLKAPRGDATSRALLERICRGRVKGKGREGTGL